MIDSSDESSSARNGCGSIANQPRMALRVPVSPGWYMIRQTSATAAIVTTTGRKAAVLMNQRYRAGPSMSSARTSPRTSEPAVVPSASTTLCQMAERKASSVRMVA